MAINTRDAGFRDLLLNGTHATPIFNTSNSEQPVTPPNEKIVLDLVQKKQFTAALKELITNIPLKTSQSSVKIAASKLAVSVFKQFKVSDVEKSVKQLNPREAEQLLHYVYQAFELLEDPSGREYTVVHAFHDEIFKICGHGGILRVVTSPYRLNGYKL